eukprot:TRINITY_DN335_c0_g2_i2.p1 TRINITY_DN335_c0_g2~~TRINITY_DN335_c0_g2_i2.p1  ORF type:complete len:618 (-),score=115.92 TRINITY_DN335_c0_g2_i2:494-2347(-)
MQRVNRHEAFAEHFSTVDVSKLKNLALSGDLQHLPFRSICWKLFFDIISPTPGLKSAPASLMKVRESYEKRRDSLLADPRQSKDVDAIINNPLSQSDESPWAKFFQNEELQKEINKDVERTFPDQDFFQDKEVRKMMLHILFVYAKENPNLGYKQGMHELLAPILYLVNREKSSFQKEAAGDVFAQLTDEKYVEHDSAEIFFRLMETCCEWFSSNQQASSPKATPVKSTPLAQEESVGAKAEPPTMSSAVRKCHRIHHILLKSKDEQLYQFLESQKIEPQIYCLYVESLTSHFKQRIDLFFHSINILYSLFLFLINANTPFYARKWIRLLFGREFHLEDVMTLWDAIFASDISSFIEYVAVAMLIYIREHVIGKDSMMAMKRLLKFPPVEDVTAISKLASQLRQPGYQHFQKKTYAPAPILSGPQSVYDPLGAGDRAGAIDRPKGSKISSVSTSNPTFGIYQSPAAKPSSAGPASGSARNYQPQGFNPSTGPSTSQRLVSQRHYDHENKESAQSLQSRVRQLEKRNEQLLRLQQEMSQRLQATIENFQTELLDKGVAEVDENKVFVTLAELKQVKDILSHTIEIPEDYLYKGPTEKEPTTPPPGRGKAVDPLGALIS